MLKGVANSGGGDPSEDRYGTVVALSQLSQSLTEADADSVFAVAAEAAAALLRVQRVAIFVKHECDELMIGNSAGAPLGREFTSAARDVAFAALKSSGPLVYPDTATGASAAARVLSGAGVASIVCVPMRVSNASVGAVVAMSDTPRTFTPADVELLHVVASHAALAAWRSDSLVSTESEGHKQDDLIRLADRKIQELSLLNQVSEAMSSTLDLDLLLDVALEESLAAIDADAGSLMLISEETNKLEIVASRGLARKTIASTSQEIGKSIAGWVAKNGESVLVTDAQRDPRFQMRFFRDSITSSASVPLKSKGVVIGVLNVNTIHVDKIFDERDLQLLGTVANQMAVAIDNARLYARVNRRTQQLDSLLQISRTITSTLNLDEVMHRLTGEICSLFQLDVCVLLFQDELSGRLRFGHGIGLKTRRKYVYYDLAAPLAARAKVTGSKLILRDITLSTALCTDAARAEGIRAAVCIPLKNQTKLVGFAVGFSRQTKQFPKSQRDIMRPLGELAGVAIHNARVYRQKYRIAEVLQQRLVPSSIPMIDGLDIGHKFLPAREVGGDYYDFIEVGRDKIGVVLADVSGSDTEAAEYTTMGKHVLRAYAREYDSPAQVLSKTNALVCESTAAEVFISTFYGVIDLRERKMRYASAGCEPVIFYRASDRSLSTLTAEGILLGIQKSTSYEEREVDLCPGDILAMFTDGLTEASVDKRRFGAKGAVDVISSEASGSAQHIADSLHDALIEFVHGRVVDDVAMVVIKMH